MTKVEIACYIFSLSIERDITSAFHKLITYDIQEPIVRRIVFCLSSAIEILCNKFLFRSMLWGNHVIVPIVPLPKQYQDYRLFLAKRRSFADSLKLERSSIYQLVEV